MVRVSSVCPSNLFLRYPATRVCMYADVCLRVRMGVRELLCHEASAQIVIHRGSALIVVLIVILPPCLCVCMWGDVYVCV